MALKKEKQPFKWDKGKILSLLFLMFINIKRLREDMSKITNKPVTGNNEDVDLICISEIFHLIFQQ